MVKNRKKLMTIIFSILIVIAMIVVVSKDNAQEADINTLPIELMEGSFVYDTDNVQEAVGMADYVFLGRVVSNDGTRYEDTVTLEDQEGRPKKVGTPYTDYTVQILENIKGTLQMDEPIKLVKHGGLEQNREFVLVFDKDCMPEEGKSYIFLAYSQPDGSLLVSGPKSNILVNASTGAVDKENMEKASAVRIYQAAYNNEVIPVERQRYRSVYEK